MLSYFNNRYSCKRLSHYGQASYFHVSFLVKKRLLPQNKKEEVNLWLSGLFTSAHQTTDVISQHLNRHIYFQISSSHAGIKLYQKGNVKLSSFVNTVRNLVTDFIR